MLNAVDIHRMNEEWKKQVCRVIEAQKQVNELRTQLDEKDH